MDGPRLTLSPWPLGVFESSRGKGSLAFEAFGRSDGGVGIRRVSLLRTRSPHAQKNCLKPHLKKQWVIPPTKSAAFVWRMEEVLDLYEGNLVKNCQIGRASCRERV